jgi:hypothetical protein
MPGVRLTASDDHEHDDHGIDVLALRSVRGDLERGPAAAIASIHTLTHGGLAEAKKEGWVDDGHNGVSSEAP